MGRPGELKRPALMSGPLKELNDALHELHLMAGLPSLTVIHKAIGRRISRSALHDALTSSSRPAWDTVDALVEILATRAPNTTPERELNRVHQLWTSAASSVMAPEGKPPDSSADSPSTLTAYWISALDIVGFAAQPYPEQHAIRQQLDLLLGEAQELAGMPVDSDRLYAGDGVVLLTPVESAGLGAVVGWVLNLERLLAQYPGDRQLRLRISLTRGLVAPTNSGWVGAALVVALRLLGSSELRTEMGAEPAASMSMIISDELHSELAKRSYLSFDIQRFRPVVVEAKESAYPVWTARAPLLRDRPIGKVAE